MWRGGFIEGFWELYGVHAELERGSPPPSPPMPAVSNALASPTAANLGARVTIVETALVQSVIVQNARMRVLKSQKAGKAVFIRSSAILSELSAAGYAFNANTGILSVPVALGKRKINVRNA